MQNFAEKIKIAQIGHIGSMLSSTNDPYVKCDQNGPHWFKFMPKTIATFSAKSLEPVTLNMPCFGETTITPTFTDNLGLNLAFNSQKKKSLLCTDFFLITNFVSHDIKLTLFPGKSSVTYNFKDERELNLVKNQGNFFNSLH